ncbi:hypothetical protein C8A03DRAFT_45672 [Achaetomium macrosporum]|uniref:DUF6604 domain-containing protein n=1 Tax=Achaetomium macrosporum TaxID=79813 RepID=A0AAN7C6I1_9PEZI|nr:hypothetical protein C8A03DRAFT_45672 [Achaetomium macrosporum]
MLPGPLVSIYQQYKKDTDSVASWLASTAKACGCPADLVSSGSWDVQAPAHRDGTRPKGKKSSKQDRGGGKYIVALADFVPLAKFIAGAANARPVSVPDSFVVTINRLIAVRAGFGKRLAEHGLKPDDGADARHSYFLGILEAVRDALRPRMSTPAAAAAAAPRSSDEAADGLANRFSALTMYEPSEAFLNAPSIERPQPVREDKTAYEAEQQVSIQDPLSAMSMMMDDLSRIRSVINWIWSNYGSSNFDLAASAVATNTATELAHSIIDDVVPVFEHHGGTWNVLNKIADRIYLIAYRILKSFLDVLKSRDLPLAKEGFFGKYNAASDAATKTGQQLADEDTILLMEFFTELMVVIRLIPNYPVQDDFLRGMREMDQTRQVPFHLVFAAQVFLDIHHTLRAKAASGGVRAVVEATVMHRELDRHFEFHRDLKIATWPAVNEHLVRELRREMDWVLKDPVYQAKVRAMRQRGMPVAPTIRPHRILHYSPVLAGLMLFQLRIRTYKVGMAVANTWGSVQYAYHLYHALQTRRLLRGPWMDMGVAHFFVGDPPRSLDGCFKKFCLQMGVTAAALANPRQRRRQQHGVGVNMLASRAGLRGFQDEGLPVSSMFAERYLGGSGQMRWTPQHIDDILARSDWEVEEGADDQVSGAYLMKQVDGAARGRGKGKGKDNDRAPPSSATIEMAFPYLTLHRQCWRLLRAVRGACDAVLRALYTPAYLERESELPFVVGYVFMAACEAPVADLRPLRYAAAAFNDWLGTGKLTLSLEVLRKMGHHVEFVEETSDAEEEEEEEENSKEE